MPYCPDIVQALRDGIDPLNPADVQATEAVMDMAADEIERLREALKDRLDLLQDAYAKIERLENKG